MEAIDFQNKVNKDRIIPLLGNESFYLGMPLEKLNRILWDFYGVHGEQEGAGYCMFYSITVKRSIRIHIEVLKQIVYQIDFLGSYQGTYQGIGIGSRISELLEVRDDVYFDEQYVLVGARPYDFVMRIDNDDATIYSLEEILHNRIVEITVENRSLLH